MNVLSSVALICALTIATCVCAVEDGSGAFYNVLTLDASHQQPASNDAPGVRVLLTDAARNGAVCLDGSPAAYYYRRGSGSGENKFYIHHQGGGYCQSDQDCLVRSKTVLGSSTTYPVTYNLGGGYFSQDPLVNPQMHNWNTIFIPYCDGGFWMGNNDTVSVVSGTKIFYRGHRMLDAIITDVLATRGVHQATDVVISGCSAGGVATFLHVDTWASRLSPSTKVRGMPDSGFVLAYPANADYMNGLLWLFHQFNSTSSVNPQCVRQHAGEEWKCFFAQYAGPFIQTPVFPLQSEFDAWQLENIIRTADVQIVNSYGANLTLLLYGSILNQPHNGVFLDSCVHHCGSWNEIRIDGKLVSQAFQEWYEKGSGVYRQGKFYPCANCCKPR